MDILDSVTIALYLLVHHYSLLFPMLILATGITFHIRYCKKNGIDPLKATPRKKYYQLRGCRWPEDY